MLVHLVWSKLAPSPDQVCQFVLFDYSAVIYGYNVHFSALVFLLLRGKNEHYHYVS